MKRRLTIRCKSALVPTAGRLQHLQRDSVALEPISAKDVNIGHRLAISFLRAGHNSVNCALISSHWYPPVPLEDCREEVTSEMAR